MHPIWSFKILKLLTGSISSSLACHWPACTRRADHLSESLVTSLRIPLLRSTIFDCPFFPATEFSLPDADLLCPRESLSDASLVTIQWNDGSSNC